MWSRSVSPIAGGGGHWCPSVHLPADPQHPSIMPDIEQELRADSWDRGGRRAVNSVRAGVWPDPLPALPPVLRGAPGRYTVDPPGSNQGSLRQHHKIGSWNLTSEPSSGNAIPHFYIVSPPSPGAGGGGGMGWAHRTMRKRTEPTSSSQAGPPKSRGRDT